MIRMFGLGFMLIGFVFPVIGSQESKKTIVITVGVGAINYNPLRYCDEKYVDRCKKFNIHCEKNEPYLAVYDYASIDQRTDINRALRSYDVSLKDTSIILPDNVKEETLKVRQTIANSKEYEEISKIFNELKHINHLPFNIFLDNLYPSVFKGFGAILFSFSRDIEGKSYLFQVNFNSNMQGGSIQDLLDQFKEQPRCEPGCFLDEKGNMPAYVDDSAVKKELLKNGILAEVNGKIIHGPNGYFGKEEFEKQRKKLESATFFSVVKKPLMGLGIFLTSYALWSLYKKYYL